MPVVIIRDILKGLSVEEAMRRQVISAPHDMSLGKCVHRLIKFKANALLVCDEAGCPVGVISKTDIVTAFYGGLPIEATLSRDIMNGPPGTCFLTTSWGLPWSFMRENGVHQLFVQGAEPCAVVGTLSYPDVVALLLPLLQGMSEGSCRAVRGCGSGGPHAVFDGAGRDEDFRNDPRARRFACRGDRGVDSAHRLGAVLIVDGPPLPVGVISKTDIIFAYHHGSNLEVEARLIMKSPIASCDENFLLTDAIRQMF